MQSGRSMVEMLGVLAVIGVLSVAGIAGYTTAMNRMKVNQVKSIVDRVMISYYTEIEKPVGTSFYDSTDGPTRVNGFCDTYAGDGFCGTISNRDFKKFVSGKVSGDNGTLQPMIQFGRNYSADKYCDNSSVNVIFELRTGNEAYSNCIEIAETIRHHYGNDICGWTYGNGGAWAIDNYKAMCDHSGGNMMGFQLPW